MTGKSWKTFERLKIFCNLFVQRIYDFFSSATQRFSKDIKFERLFVKIYWCRFIYIRCNFWWLKHTEAHNNRRSSLCIKGENRMLLILSMWIPREQGFGVRYSWRYEWLQIAQSSVKLCGMCTSVYLQSCWKLFRKL